MDVAYTGKINELLASSEASRILAEVGKHDPCPDSSGHITTIPRVVAAIALTCSDTESFSDTQLGHRKWARAKYRTGPYDWA
jgi:hypothetical protein